MAQPSHREQLLRGAIKCLQTKGYARTTARDIAAAADANLASIGYHFGSKEALLDEALIQVFEQWIEHVSGVAFASASASPIERLIAIWEEMSDAFQRNRPMLVAFTEAMAQAERSPQLRARMAEHYQRLRSRVAELIAAALGPPDAPADPQRRAAASALIALCDGYSIQWLLDPAQTPPGDQLITGLADAILTAATQSEAQPTRT